MFHFIAMEILEKRVVHSVQHDLESFYWVLLWVVLRHIKHNFSDADAQNIFVFGDDDLNAAKKRQWLDATIDRFQVEANQPLQKLLVEFGFLILKARGSKLVDPVPMGYKDVTKIFDTALSSPRWPEKDHVPCKWFDKRSGAAIPGVTSDNYDNDPIPAPNKAKTGSTAQGSRSRMPPLDAMPEGAETRSRSKRRREGTDWNAYVPRSDPEPSSRTDSSGKRLRTTRSCAAGSSNAPQRVTRSPTAGSSGTTQRVTRSATAGSSFGTTPAKRRLKPGVKVEHAALARPFIPSLLQPGSFLPYFSPPHSHR